MYHFIYENCKLKFILHIIIFFTLEKMVNSYLTDK